MLVSASTAVLVKPSCATWASIDSKTSRPLSASISSTTEEFPPLRSLYRTNLPVPSTPFLGRERELAEVVGSWLGRTCDSSHSPAPVGPARRASRSRRPPRRRTRSPTASGGCPLPLCATLASLPRPSPALGVSESRTPARRDVDVRSREGGAPPARQRRASAAGRGARRSPRSDRVRPDAPRDDRERLQLEGEQIYPVPTLRESEGRALPRTGPSPRPGIRVERRGRQSSALGSTTCRSRSSSRPPARRSSRPSSSSSAFRAPRSAQGRDVTPIRASRRFAPRSSGPMTFSTPTSSGSFAALSVFAGGCTLEAAERRLRRRSRHAPVANRQEPRPRRDTSTAPVTGCSRRSVSSLSTARGGGKRASSSAPPCPLGGRDGRAGRSGAAGTRRAPGARTSRRGSTATSVRRSLSSPRDPDLTATIAGSLGLWWISPRSGRRAGKWIEAVARTRDQLLRHGRRCSPHSISIELNRLDAERLQVHGAELLPLARELAGTCRPRAHCRRSVMRRSLRVTSSGGERSAWRR